MVSICQRIGVVYLYLEKLELSSRYFVESLRIQKLLLQHNHEDIEHNLFSLATVLNKMGFKEKSSKFFNEALEIKRNRGEHEDIAVKLYNNGLEFENKKEYEILIGCLEESLWLQEARRNFE